jgi:hypothetical protein
MPNTMIYKKAVLAFFFTFKIEETLFPNLEKSKLYRLC